MEYFRGSPATAKKAYMLPLALQEKVKCELRTETLLAFFTEDTAILACF